MPGGQGRYPGLKVGHYRGDKAAGRVALSKGGKKRFIMSLDRWNPATGEQLDDPIEVELTVDQLKAQKAALEDKVADVAELITDIEALG